MEVWMTGVLPNSLKDWGVCYHVYMIGDKRTCVDQWNMPNHHIYLQLPCVSVCEWQH